MLGTDLLKEEFKMLVRATRNERFRFIIIQYNHFSLTDRVKLTLQNTYPNRTFNAINIGDTPQENFINALLNFEKGFVFIYGFEKLLAEDYRSLAIGFNQRRDKFSDHPIILVAFLPWGEHYLHQFQKTMPDFFSLANPIIQLEHDIKTNINFAYNILSTTNDFKNREEAIIEIEEIKSRLKTLVNTSENLNLKFILTRRLSAAYSFLADFKNALAVIFNFLNAKEKSVFSSNLKSVFFNDIGVCYYNLGVYKKSLDFNTKSIDEQLKDNNHFTIELASNYNNIGTCYLYLKKQNKAIQYLLKGIEITKLLNDNFSPIVGTLLSNLGLVYLDLKDFKNAEEYFNNNLDFCLRVYGERHAQTAISYNNFGTLFSSKKEYAKALEYSEKSLKIRLSIYGENHPEIANSYNNLGAVYSHVGEFSKAKSYYEKAYTILIQTLGENHPDTKMVFDNMMMLA